MMEFTMVDYWRYQAKFPSPHILSDQEERYERKETHQYHDKVFKKILDNKKEFIHLIKRYTKYKTTEVEEEKLEKYSPNLITSGFKTKELDIIYKVKGRDVFIIVEHQSTIDYKMPERMTEYCVQLIRMVKERTKIDTGLYPLICPIVLYTGRKKWDAPMSITNMQEECYGFEPLHYPRYNLIDINDYTKEELMEDNTAVAKAMLFEKLDSEDILKYQKNLEGGIDMTNFERLLIELIDEKIEKYKAAEKLGVKNVIINMIKMKMTDKNIIDATQINKNELQKIKQELKVS